MNLIHLKEKIVIGERLTPAERNFVLDCINASSPPQGVLAKSANFLARIDSIWAFLSVDEGGEGVCAMPIGGMTVPMIAADERRLVSLRPAATIIANMFKKPVRLVRFKDREELEIFRPEGEGDDGVRTGRDQADQGGANGR